MDFLIGELAVSKSRTGQISDEIHRRVRRFYQTIEREGVL